MRLAKHEQSAKRLARFSSRFARLTGLLVQRVPRLIDINLLLVAVSPVLLQPANLVNSVLTGSYIRQTQ